jgi:pimeloyl-ACP methyl ester carboxylesterase
VSEVVSSGAFDGATLAYREQGDGEPVVLVHGSSSDLRTLERQLSPIGASYRAIAYSRRYARPNQDIEPRADDRMLPHVDDLVAFLRLTDRRQQLLPSAERVEIADASHLMHEENAAAVNRAILDFLSRTTAARRPVVR